MAAKTKKSASKRAKREKVTSANKRAVPAKPRASKTSRSTSARKSRASEIGQLAEPKSPMPAQHQRKPGLESKLDPRPRYEAPHYKGADKLKNKVALITGGDSGIGRAVAVLFAREGADVAFTYLPEEESDALDTATAIAAEGRRAVPISGDLLDSEFCRRSVTQTVSRLGKLDIL